MISVITGICLFKQSKKRGGRTGSQSQDFFGMLPFFSFNWQLCSSQYQLFACFLALTFQRNEDIHESEKI